MSSDIHIIDNFLEKNVFLQIKELLFSTNFPWFYNNSKSFSSIENDKHFQFTHNLYVSDKGGIVNSNFFDTIFPLIEKINPISLIRVKVNLTTKSNKNEIYGFHTDLAPQNFIKTGIFYLNNSNGGTIFENNEIIDCVENRFVFFPSGLTHSAISATDTKARIVINFNYI